MLEPRRMSKVSGRGPRAARLPVDEGSMVAVMGPSGKSMLASVRAPRYPATLNAQKQPLCARNAPPTSRDAAMHTRRYATSSRDKHPSDAHYP